MICPLERSPILIVLAALLLLLGCGSINPKPRHATIDVPVRKTMADQQARQKKSGKFPGL
jgi:uncharacterized protein YceK